MSDNTPAAPATSAPAQTEANPAQQFPVATPEFDEKQLARLLDEYSAYEKSMEGFGFDSETTTMDEALKTQLEQLHGWMKSTLSLGKQAVRQQQLLIQAIESGADEDEDEEDEGLTSVLYDQDATYLMSVLDDYRQLLEQTLESLPSDAPDEKLKAFKRRVIVAKQAINFISTISDIESEQNNE
jgi:hypothetical protein